MCLTLCDPMDYSPPDSSVHGILPNNTGMGSHSLRQWIFPTQGLNPGLPHSRYSLSSKPAGKPHIYFTRLLWEISEIMDRKSLAQCLECSKESMCIKLKFYEIDIYCIHFIDSENKVAQSKVIPQTLIQWSDPLELTEVVFFNTKSQAPI